MFCCGAEIVPKRSQCEQKPYPLCNLQRSLLIWKDNLPIRGSVAISAPIKVFRLDSDRLKNRYPIRNVPLSTASGAVLFRSRNCFESSIPSVNRSPIRYTFCDAPFHYPVQCEHSLNILLVSRTEHHLSSFECGFLNMFPRQNLLHSLSRIFFLLRWNKYGAKKCLKNHIPFDYWDDSTLANQGAGKTIQKPLKESHETNKAGIYCIFFLTFATKPEILTFDHSLQTSKMLSGIIMEKFGVTGQQMTGFVCCVKEI